MTDQTASVAEWTPKEVEAAERIAASHYLDLKGAEACYYAYESEAYWHRQELVSRDAIDPYANEDYEPLPDEHYLRASLAQGERSPLTIHSPNYCNLAPRDHIWVYAAQQDWGDEPPF